MNLKQKSHGNIAIRDIAPDFKVETKKFHEWLGDSWGSYFRPADFTPVCTTELGTVANYYPDLLKRKKSDCVKCMD
jgi:alkyl hydroperoxide reductase subunit AhpC